MNYQVSIITICYNDIKGLKRTIPTVLSQTRKDFEWIIVDGASTDSSRDYIKEIAESYTDIRIIWSSEPDSGIFNAMNKGVAKASGEYCLFLNAGDIFCSKKSIERAYKRKWEADVISCDEFLISEGKLWDYIQSPRALTFHRILRGYLPHQTTFIRRALLLEHPYREEYKIVADWAFWWETLIAGDSTYQHFDFPLAAFDLSGVSSTNKAGNRIERDAFLAQYFPDECVRNRVINECLLPETIEGDFLFNSERSLLSMIFITVRRIYAHIIQPLNTIYNNYRWL